MILLETVDLILIAPYRWPSDPIIGWWIGTAVLALWTVLLGWATYALAFRINGTYIEKVSREVVHHHKNSMAALKAGDKASYTAINDLANDAFGQSYFLLIATGASFLWPIPLALAWLQSRFSGVQFGLPFPLPFVGDRVSYAFIFIPLYILMRIAFSRLRKTIWGRGVSVR